MATKRKSPAKATSPKLQFNPPAPAPIQYTDREVSRILAPIPGGDLRDFAFDLLGFLRANGYPFKPKFICTPNPLTERREDECYLVAPRRWDGWDVDLTHQVDVDALWRLVRDGGGATQIDAEMRRLLSELNPQYYVQGNGSLPCPWAKFADESGGKVVIG